MSATASTSVNYNSFNKINMANAEFSQELHLKMSKKIAQLTKVIYGLNTKNDEHDIAMEQLKQQYEEKVLLIMAETKERVASYQSQIGNEVERKQQIAHLQEVIREHEKNREIAQKQFSAFKSEVLNREKNMVSQHSDTIINLTQQIQNLQKNLEENERRYGRLKEEFERRKQAAIEELHAKHQEQLSALSNSQKNLENNLSNASEQLHKKYQAEIAVLRKKILDIETESKKNIEEAEEKLRKAQAFHEREMEAMKASREKAEGDTAMELKKQMEKLRKEYYENRAASQQRIEDLLSKFSASEDLVEELKKQIARASKTEVQNSKQINSMEEEMKELREEIEKLTSDVREKTRQLTVSEESNKFQRTDILKKAELLGEMQATIMQLETKLSTAKTECDSLRSRLEALKEEKKSLETVTYSRSSEHESQLALLREHITSLAEEKNQLRENMIIKIEQEKTLAAANEKELKKKFETDIEKLRKKAEKDFQALLERKENEMVKLREEYEAKLDTEYAKKKKLTEDMGRDLERAKKEVNKVTEKWKEEVDDLKKQLRDHTNGLGNATTQVENLQSECDKLRKQVQTFEKKWQTATKEVEKLRVEIESLQQTNENLLKETKVNWNNKLADLSTELDRKWAETLRRECGRLRTQLQEQAQADKKAALDHLTKLKTKEIEQLRSQQGMRITELEMTDKDLRQRLQEIEALLSIEKEKSHRLQLEGSGKLNEQMRSMEVDHALAMQTAQESFQSRLQEIQAEHECELQRLEETLQRNFQRETELKENMFQTEMEKERSAIQEKHATEIEKMKQVMEQERNQMRFQLQQKFASQLDGSVLEYKQIMQQLEEQLTQTQNNLKRKEADMSINEERFNAALKEKERIIIQHKEAVTALQQQLNELKNEVGQKSGDVERVKEEIINKAKKREQELANQYTRELKNITTLHETDRQKMMAEFEAAHLLLKEKLTEFRVRYQEMEERYAARPSKEEDLELIDSLRGQLKSAEKEAARLLEEKRYYQMELVNRETNFNKLFNTSPQIGTINPLLTTTSPSNGSITGGKKTTPLGQRTVQRLAPLPNSPLHDDPLTPSKPLPPPHSKR